MEKLSQQAVVLYLNTLLIYHDTIPNIARQISKGTPQVDLLLIRRDVMKGFEIREKSDTMTTNYLRQPVPNEKYVFHIPDSLSNRFVPATDDDYELSFNTILQFSPLLPTIDPEIYLMQCYDWHNVCGTGEFCIKVMYRDFIWYRVTPKGITLLPGPVNYNVLNQTFDNMFMLGGFKYSQLQNAKPGDKIKWE